MDTRQIKALIDKIEKTDVVSHSNVVTLLEARGIFECALHLSRIADALESARPETESLFERVFGRKW